MDVMLGLLYDHHLPMPTTMMMTMMLMTMMTMTMTMDRQRRAPHQQESATATATATATARCYCCCCAWHRRRRCRRWSIFLHCRRGCLPLKHKFGVVEGIFVVREHDKLRRRVSLQRQADLLQQPRSLRSVDARCRPVMGQEELFELRTDSRFC